MNKRRIALLGVLAVLAAVWVASATLPPTAAPATSAATSAAPSAARPARDARPKSSTQAAQAGAQAAQRRDVTSFDLNDAAERLHARLQTTSHPVTPERNPFEFAPAPTTRRAEPAPIPVALPAVPTGPVPPPFALTGVAEHKNGETLERTAILTGNTPGAGGANEIYFAKAGEKVLGRYEVTAVGADAIELRELASGQIVRLGLR